MPRTETPLSARFQQFVVAVREGDEAMVEEMLLALSARRRIFAPLAFVVGGFAMLFTGLKLLFTNWRLTLVQALPAMWIWLTMYDLKAHVLHDRSFHVLTGPVLIPIALVIVAITVASFLLNATFGYAIVQPGAPAVRPAFAQARRNLRVIVGFGIAVGLLLAFAMLISSRWERPWFAVSLGIAIGLLMVCYVAVPARLIGVKAKPSRRDQVTATAVGGAVGAIVCTPPYVLGRIGILMCGSSALLIPGIVVVAAAALLQAGATGAVKTIKMSAKLVSPRANS